MTSEDSPIEAIARAADADRDVLVVALTEQGRWSVSKASRGGGDAHLLAGIEDCSVEDSSSHRFKIQALHAARRRARSTTGGAVVVSREHESGTVVLLEKDLRSRWLWGLLALAALTWPVTPDTLGGGNLLAAVGGVLMAVSVTGLTQAAFASRPGRSPADPDLLHQILLRFATLAVAGAVLSMLSLAHTQAGDGVAGFIADRLPVMATMGSLVLLVSLMAGLIKYTLEGSDTPGASGAGTAGE